MCLRRLLCGAFEDLRKKKKKNLIITKITNMPKEYIIYNGEDFESFTQQDIDNMDEDTRENYRHLDKPLHYTQASTLVIDLLGLIELNERDVPFLINSKVPRRFKYLEDQTIPMYMKNRCFCEKTSIEQILVFALIQYDFPKSNNNQIFVYRRIKGLRTGRFVDITILPSNEHENLKHLDKPLDLVSAIVCLARILGHVEINDNERDELSRGVLPYRLNFFLMELVLSFMNNRCFDDIYDMEATPMTAL